VPDADVSFHIFRLAGNGKGISSAIVLIEPVAIALGDLMMGKLLKTILICALSFAVIMPATAIDARALARSSGDYWTWDVSTTSDGVDVTGTLTFTYDGRDTLSVNGTSYEVNVMSISGALNGSTTLLGMPLVLNATLSGTIYELRDSLATVKEDTFTWSNLTWGTGGFVVVIRTETEVMTSNSPPQLSGFEPDTSGPGDSWNEASNTTTVTTTWSNGTMQSQTTTYDRVSTSVVIASSEVSVSTPAGTFDAMRITATDADGNYEVYHYSDRVRNFVKIETYDVGSTAPSLTLQLSSYHSSKPPSSTAILLMVVGIAIAVLAIIVILVLMTRRRGRTPQPVQPQTPAQPPAQ